MVGVGDLLGDDNPTLCHMGIISYAIIRIPSLNNQCFFSWLTCVRDELFRSSSRQTRQSWVSPSLCVFLFREWKTSPRWGFFTQAVELPNWLRLSCLPNSRVIIYPSWTYQIIIKVKHLVFNATPRSQNCRPACKAHTAMIDPLGLKNGNILQFCMYFCLDA